MEVNKKKIFKLDIIFFVVLLAVGFYFFYKSAPPATAPDTEDVGDTSEVSTDLPEGVSVEVLENGDKLVKNEKDGYEVKVFSKYYIYKDFEGDLKVQNYIEPTEPYGGSAGCSVYFNKSERKSESDIKGQYQNNCDNVVGTDCKYVDVKKFNYSGKDWTRFSLIGDFVGTNNPTFITYDGNYMYSLSFPCTDENFIEDILNNFSF